MLRREDEELARVAVAALTRQVLLFPKPGLPGPRDLTVRTTGRDHHTLLWSAKALCPGLAAMAAAARRTASPTPVLRAGLSAIGRCTEHTIELAGGGHRGALWTLGTLVAAVALDPSARGADITATARRLAAHPDRGAPLRPSRGSAMSAKYGAADARGEARAGFPHVRRALTVLGTARSDGVTESSARLDALLTVMSTLPDTELLYTAGPVGLRHVQAGARSVLEAGGTATPAGAEALTALDADLRIRGWSPRGSAGLPAGALFLDAPAVADGAFPAAPGSGGATRSPGASGNPSRSGQPEPGRPASGVTAGPGPSSWPTASAPAVCASCPSTTWRRTVVGRMATDEHAVVPFLRAVPPPDRTGSEDWPQWRAIRGTFVPAPRLTSAGQ